MSVAVVLVTQTDIKEWWGRGQLLGGGGEEVGSLRGGDAHILSSGYQ